MRENFAVCRIEPVRLKIFFDHLEGGLGFFQTLKKRIRRNLIQVIRVLDFNQVEVSKCIPSDMIHQLAKHACAEAGFVVWEAF